MGLGKTGQSIAFLAALCMLPLGTRAAADALLAAQHEAGPPGPAAPLAMRPLALSGPVDPLAAAAHRPLAFLGSPSLALLEAASVQGSPAADAAAGGRKIKIKLRLKRSQPPQQDPAADADSASAASAAVATASGAPAGVDVRITITDNAYGGAPLSLTLAGGAAPTGNYGLGGGVVLLGGAGVTGALPGSAGSISLLGSTGAGYAGAAAFSCRAAPA